MNQKEKILGRLPGDLSKEELIARIIRVDQAGEYGAKRIYEGQLSVLSGTKDEPVLREMADTEVVHLDTFNKIMVERRVRPTLLAPLWHVAGFALGAGTALMGRFPRKISPWVAGSNPASIIKQVVLPEPEGPSMVKNSPRSMSRLRFLMTSSSPS